MTWAEMSKDERIAVIRAGIEKGLSASLIGQELHTTRNAVIGYWTRNRAECGLETDISPVPAKIVPQRRGKAASKAVPEPIRIAIAPPKARPEPEPIFLPVLNVNEPRVVTLLEAGNSRCKRPLWGEEKPVPPIHRQFVCGAPVKPLSDRPYCPDCMKLIYREYHKVPVKQGWVDRKAAAEVTA
jgi:hypothetical protein